MLISSISFSQRKLKEYRIKTIKVEKDSIAIDSVSINPDFFNVLTIDKEKIPKTKYRVDFPKALLFIDKTTYPQIIVEYLRYPDFLTKIYSPLDDRLIVPNTNTEKLYSLTTNKQKSQLKLFDGLKTQGFIVRGVTSGNNQNAVTNASLDLTIEGKISKDVSIKANIFDTNFPLQQSGYSQNITDFDRIFIELFSKNWGVKGGDVSLENKDSYFLNFKKQVTGIQVNANLSDKTSVGASGAIVRGRFSSFNFVGLEGNQGPYKILGPNNETNIVIVAGSDAVFVNGAPLKRGENADYVIDYNLGEIRFNTTYPITNDMRIRIEFQFSDQNYTRFITYEKAAYSDDNFSISGYFYNENDAKNQPIQQNLSDNQKEILANAGNDVSQMVSSSAFVDEFSANRIQYKKTVQNTTEFFEFSNDENDELYTVTFSNVGANNGDYVVDNTIAIGTIYRYVGVNQGNFAPITQLIAPNSLQVAVLNANYIPSEKTTINAELAYSDNDANLFSTIDDEKNKQIAAKIKWDQTLIAKKWKLTNTANYEFVQENFKTVQRFRNVEFNRDWNLRSTIGNQHLFNTALNYSKDKDNSFQYRFNHLSFADSFKGNKHELFSKLKSESTLFQLQTSLLNNSSEMEEDSFFRIQTNGEKHFKKTWIGGFINAETNEIKEKTTNSLNLLSHQFQEYEGYFGIGDTAKVYAKIGLNYRRNDSIRNNRFTEINNRNTIYLKSQLIKNKTTNLGVFASYRFTDNKFIENEQHLNSKMVYNQQFFKNFLSLNTVYETSSGNIPQQDFVYVKTEPGQGFYTWIDYNNDGIQQFEEFEIAQFQDQATYLRVALPNIRFLPTQKVSWKQTITLNPFQWKSKKGFKKFISHFYNQSYLSVNNEQQRADDGFNLNPFKLDDDKLVGLQFNFRNSFYYNRSLQKNSWTYTYGTSKNKQQFSIGNQENNAEIHQIEFQHKLSPTWLFEVNGATSKNELKTENLLNRNYNINTKELLPKLSYLYSKNHRFSIFYQLKDKKNTMADFEQLNLQKVGAEYFFISKKQNQISADFNVFLNRFNGDPNSPVGYQMLEGLQSGTNYTWNVLVNQKLNSLLNLSVNYFGRKSETSKVIHTGTVQLKAIF